MLLTAELAALVMRLNSSDTAEFALAVTIAVAVAVAVMLGTLFKFDIWTASWSSPYASWQDDHRIVEKMLKFASFSPKGA